jgi:hypothetical protein
MFECQATEKQSRRRVSERKEIFPNTNKFHPKRELAMKWLHNIGAGHSGKNSISTGKWCASTMSSVIWNTCC